MEKMQELENKLHQALLKNQELEFVNISLQSKKTILESANAGLVSANVELESIKAS